MATIQERNPKISIVILNYNTDELIANLLSSLNGDNNQEIILVDNSEQNRLEEVLKNNFPRVRYFFIGKNVGFAGGVNYGIQKATGTWIVILNSDTEVNGTELQKLVAIAEKEQFLVASPKIFYKNGAVQNNVGYFDTISQHPLNWLLARPRFLNCLTINNKQSVDFATGACLLIHSSVFETIGLFDAENFFMYFEDIDFSYRLYKNQLPILYVPEVSIIHYEGASADQNSAKKSIFYNRGLYNYVKKHRNTITALLNGIFKWFQ